MPHLTVEYSASEEIDPAVGPLVRELHAALLSSGLFEPGAIRVRAHRADVAAIADLLPRNGFVDMVLRIGAGRSLEDKRAVGEAIMAAARSRLSGLLATPHFALSLEVREIDPALSWKLNTIHPRLRDASRP